MKRSIVLAGVLLLSLTGTFAFAATLGLAGGSVGAGSAGVAACDTDGFTVTHPTTTVTSVTVGDLADPQCEGASISVRAVNAAGDSIGAGGPRPVPVDADSLPNSVTIPLTPTPAETQIAGFRIVVTGP